MSESNQPQETEKPEKSDDVKNNQHVLDQYFDTEYTKAIIEKLGRVCLKTYFRHTLINFDTLPERNRADTPFVLISNHSGMAFPWDAMVFGAEYNHPFDYSDNSLRALVAPMLSHTTLMNPYQIKHFWKKMGGIDATFLNFETLMQQKRFNVMMYPEGVPGIGKGFNRRYQLQKFHTSFVRMAVKYKTDLFWMSSINGEYINPYSYSFGWVNNITKRIGIPFLPITLMLVLVILQPWFFYFAFPARLRFVLGPKIKAYEMVDKPYEEISQEEFQELSLKIREICQAHLTASEKEHGRPHFHWREMFSTMWRNRNYFPFYLPIVWPLIFNDFDRKYNKLGHANFNVDISFLGLIKMLFRNPIFIAYLIPIFGWIPLLIKGYKDHEL